MSNCKYALTRDRRGTRSKAKNLPSPALLNFRDIQLQKLVEPRNELLSTPTLRVSTVIVARAKIVLLGTGVEPAYLDSPILTVSSEMPGGGSKKGSVAGSPGSGERGEL